MTTFQKHILFFDFFENDYISKHSLNVVKTSFVKEEGNAMIKSSHPPFKTIIISHRGEEIKASPIKIPNADPKATIFMETKKII